jgi:RND family efflux transporter MFP subunit
MKQTVFSLLLLIAIAGCGHDHDNGHDDDHGHDHGEAGHEEAVLIYTVYTQHTELFVEFAPLVVGSESRFAAHFTMLGELFKPVTEGSVTLLLTGDNGSQQIVANEPEVPGIFRLRLTPEQTGVYDLVFLVNTPAYSDTITIPELTVYASADEAHGHHPAEPEVSYLKEQAWKVEFANQRVSRQPFYHVINTTGKVDAAQGDEVLIAAKSPGIVSLAGRQLFAGSQVSAGQTLFTVSTKGFVDGNTEVLYRQAKTDYDLAKANFERNEQLLESQLITRQQYEQSKAAFESAEAVYNNLLNTMGSGGQNVSSPQSGFLKTVFVTEGSYVETGQPLAVVARNQRLVVRAEISLSDYARAGTIASANFKTADGSVYSLEELNGSLISVGKAADNLFIPVFFEVDNRAGIVPGAFIQVFLKSATFTDAITIPATALVEEQGNYFAYVQKGGESFQKRQLLLGGNDGKQVLVLSGIAEGERVVTRGAHDIKRSMASGTLPAHGHEH